MSKTRNNTTQHASQRSVERNDCKLTRKLRKAICDCIRNGRNVMQRTAENGKTRYACLVQGQWYFVAYNHVTEAIITVLTQESLHLYESVPSPQRWYYHPLVQSLNIPTNWASNAKDALRQNAHAPRGSDDELSSDASQEAEMFLTHFCDQQLPPSV